jgi:hypothetical protein
MSSCPKIYSHDSLNYLLEMLRSESDSIPLVPVLAGTQSLRAAAWCQRRSSQTIAPYQYISEMLCASRRLLWEGSDNGIGQE